MHSLGCLARFVVLIALSGLTTPGTGAVNTRVSTSTTRTVVVGGNASYFVPSTPTSEFRFSSNGKAKATLEALGGSGDLIPFSFITTSSSHFSQADLSQLATQWAKLDDVWSPAFLEGEGSIPATRGYSLIKARYIHHFHRARESEHHVETISVDLNRSHLGCFQWRCTTHGVNASRTILR